MPHLSPVNWMFLIMLFWFIINLFLSYSWWNSLNHLFVVKKLYKKNNMMIW
uniref:ATP synthase F0 subunit 8 n=1 Tax=Haemadipsa yanyuanensis TaxID=2870508 RepID=UPI0023D7BCB4|nr:ATP synthase F0 subunit 8 [Haemadipsa yanyuanensis]WDA96159.1 ATP synthase F0 subunit 8 [Haemadipsa yanyuanensis]